MTYDSFDLQDEFGDDLDDIAMTIRILREFQKRPDSEAPEVGGRSDFPAGEWPLAIYERAVYAGLSPLWAARVAGCDDIDLICGPAPVGDVQPQPEGAALNAERLRQVAAEGWTPEHDDDHIGWDLTRAAGCYIAAADYASAHGKPLRPVPEQWPWEVRFWKPTDDPVRMLAKAGALIAAEIDLLRRAADGSLS